MKPRILSTVRLSLPLAFAIAALLGSKPLCAATYYWDNNGTGAGYGTAAGTWAAPTVGSATQGWTIATNGTTAPTGSITTLNTNATTDAVNFGNGASGLAPGTITVSGPVASGNMTFAAGSGAIVLSGSQIDFAATSTITVNNSTDTINSILGGAGTSLTKAGTGTLVLTGGSIYTGTTIINAGTLNLGGGTADGSLSSGVLALGGGSLTYTRTGTNTQAFTTTSITGASMITGAVGNTLNLGTVSRGIGNSFYDFGATGLGIVAADTTSNDATGIMAAFTVGDSWAVANGAGVAIGGLAGASYTLTSANGATAASYASANVDVDDNSGILDAAVTINSLRFSEAEANTLTLAAGPNTITSGGILVGNAVGSNLSAITGGTLTGAASKDLAIIQNNTSGGLTISSSIVNTTLTSVTKSGAGLLTLDANNTFTGGVVINAGTLALGNAGALNSTAGSQNAVAFGGSSTGTLSLAGNSVVVASLSTNAIPGATFVQNANGSSVADATLTVGNSANLSGTFGGIIQDGTGGGTLALTKAGTGTLTLPGANTYSGGTSIAAGTVVISNATSFGASTGAVTVTGTTARINVTGGITYANDIVVNGPLTMQNPVVATSTATFSGVLSGASSLSLPNTGTNGQQGILAFTNTANTFTGDVVLSASGAGDEHFQFNSIGDGGKFTFAKNGNRQLITHTGSSDITFATRTINIASTMTNITTRQGMDGGGGNPVSSFFSSGTGALTFNANMGMTSLASDGVFYFNGTNAGNNTFAGTIGDPTGAGRLWIGKLGTGTWLLTGDNTYEGGTIIANGILSVSKIENAANAQPLGKGPIIQFGVGNNGTSGSLVFTGSTGATTDKQVAIGAINQANSSAAGSILNNGSGTMTFSNANFNPTISGNVVAGITTNAVTVARTLTIGGTNPGANTISGIIQNNNGATGTVAITKTGTGTWVLSSSNTYTGNTAINAGVLEAVAGTGLPATSVLQLRGGVLQSSGTFSRAVSTAAGAVNWGTGSGGFAAKGAPLVLNLNGGTGNLTWNGASMVPDGQTLIFGSTSADNLVDFQNTLNLGSGTVQTRTITVNDNPGSATDIARISGAITNTTAGMSLIKSGDGTLELTGANTYTGNTTVAAGTLTLADNAQLKFVLGGTSNSNNSLSGAGTVTLEGDFVIDTTAANALPAGSSWTLESVTSLSGAYGANFTVDGFTNAGSDKWTKANGATVYTFDETTGVLSLSAAAGYGAWQGANGTGQAIDLDHDNDGVPNGVEYFLFGSGNSTGFTPLPEVVGNTVTWKKAAVGYSGNYITDYVVETSSTLTGVWGTAALGVNPGEVVISGDDVIYTFPAGTKNFARLKVTGP